MGAWAAAYLVQKELEIETILHFPTRGRNLLRVQGDLLAAYAMGIRNLFVTMGDPTRIGDYPEAMDSYDIVPTGLIRLIKKQFNSGLDKAGGTIDQATNFVAGAALSLTPTKPDREIRLLAKKISNGADFALTQPVFEVDKAISFIERCQSEFGAEMLPLLVGIKPLYNGRNAEFLHNEVPGIYIPAEQQTRMHDAKHPQQEGVKIAGELLAEIRPFAAGTYLMPAFSRYDLIAELLERGGG
jgi:homocysteine S-methyltransferase